MAKSPFYKQNDKGGYGNPPVSHQFKGKPGPGRPKGSKSLEAAMRKAFGKKLTRVDKSGKRTSISAPEALAERALELGLKGPLTANIEARKLAAKYGPQEMVNLLNLEGCSYAQSLVALYVLNVGSGETPNLSPFERRFFDWLEEVFEEEYDVEKKKQGILFDPRRMSYSLYKEDQDSHD